MLVICLLNNIVLRGRGFCTSSIAQITGNVPRLLADIVVVGAGRIIHRLMNFSSLQKFASTMSALHSVMYRVIYAA